MEDEAERVILVDAGDAAIGTVGKLEAHMRGALHRAFSVFVVNSSSQVLLQRRALGKYHGGGLWSNSCCGHPRPGEATEDAARRRLQEEMGIDCPVEPVFSFTYRAEMPGGLTEHEIDHVFVGQFDGDPLPDPREVGEWEWVPAAAIRADIVAHPAAYTPWLETALSGLLRRRPALGVIVE
jgi:isopentenyl-diphosphate delta-isomerase